MKIGIAGDHSAVELKKELIDYLSKKGYELINYGTDTTQSVDYPNYGETLGKAVMAGEVERGIAICGTGIGIGIACNKVEGIRCGICSDPYSARMACLHNNAQIIAFGARVVGDELAKMIVDTFLETEFEGGRHQRRVDLLNQIR
ncbi:MULTISPECIES: ribose 5-phosphate isomerase B [Terrabacteria group]|uniref:ribose 5-phosphate isomerase B n=1 Tax=Bacillati TaxID=1783272 RepID=UPI001939927B|nr:MULTISPECIES: ribose 5-phosphate isomerase B [Terrabacteria group]MBW9212596.1 ribose 5-phosphate isomerase B [Trueperella sp. zg.1013]QRG86909.1 ribose 5-phosphate isomerase B [Bulleidia sp. zg-1006]